jgi:hypothetical protein
MTIKDWAPYSRHKNPSQFSSAEYRADLYGIVSAAPDSTLLWVLQNTTDREMHFAAKAEQIRRKSL